MPDLLTILILFVVGCFAGIMNVMAGGGSTLSLPVLIMLGVDAGVANGTNRVAIAVQNVAAVGSFARDKRLEFSRSAIYALWALPGAIAGAFLATQVTDEWTERVIGIVLILVVLSMAVPQPMRRSVESTVMSRWIGPALLVIGFYGGFIQVGVGFLFMAAFYHLLRLDLVSTTVQKITVILIYTIPTLAVFALSNKVDWALGFALATGNATGAFFAARLAVRRGEKVIRYVLMVAVLMMALRILNIV